jgi:hypothetical protein
MKSITLIVIILVLLSSGSILYAQTDWSTMIDTTWGEGLPTADKLQIFDTFWETIDSDYAGFHNRDVNWDSLRNVYRPMVEAGVSRGRFSAIMDQLHLALLEMHTFVYDVEVRETELKPGVPLLVFWFENYAGDHGYFGAGLTPLPDSTAFVYKVVDNHPLDLEPGDIVLGYDGIPWKYLYQDLLEAELPVTSFYEPVKNIGLGSSEWSVSHIWLMSVGLNWHLFDTIDILKYGSGDTLHLATNVLSNLNEQLICTEQMPIPGIDFPDIASFDKPLVTYGMVDGTQIGYIYVCSWLEELGDGPAFSNAVNTLIDEHQAAGIIIDTRANMGGQMEQANGGLRRLFNFNLEELHLAERSHPDNHLSMRQVTTGYCSGENFRFSADQYLYDRPIAVLTGPSTVSAGDYNSLRLKFHPMVRIFGKPTNTAFTCFTTTFFNVTVHEDWLAGYAPRNAYLADSPIKYLIHVGFDVDEEVWLTQEDVIKGEDTVVKRAIEWIQNLAHAHDVTVDKTYAAPGSDHVVINTIVENPNENDLSVKAYINTDSGILDSLSLFDDGQHNDGSENDGTWGNSWLTLDEEQQHKIDVKTVDSTANSSRTLPQVRRFTTIGPLSYAGLSPYVLEDTIANPGDGLSFKFYLKNEGEEAAAENIDARLYSNTSKVVIHSHYSAFGNIAAGNTVESTQGYSFVISSDIYTDTTIYLTLEISSGDYHYWTDSIPLDIITSIDNSKNKIPTTYALRQNFPNPFNPTTMINYELPITNDVDLSIYNLLGQKVVTLVLGKKNAGYHQVKWDASGFASGIYYYKIESGEFVDVKKMILLR